MRYLRLGCALLTSTLPLLGLRVGAALLFGLALAIYLGIAAGLAWLLGQMNGLVGVIVFVVALAAILPIYSWTSRYVFYLLKSAHVAVMVEILEHGHLPEGHSQLAWGKAQVQARFRDTSALFLVHELVTGVVRAFGNTIGSLTNWLPIEGIGSLVSLLKTVMHVATDGLDQAILSRAYLQREQNVWAVARDGLVLYGMCWKPILKQALLLSLLSICSIPVFILLIGVPALGLAAVLPAAARGAVPVIVIVFAVLLKLTLSDSLSLAALLALYHEETRGLVPNPEWEAKLEGVSDTFRQLQQRAAEAMAPAPTMVVPVPSRLPPADVAVSR